MHTQITQTAATAATVPPTAQAISEPAHGAGGAFGSPQPIGETFRLLESLPGLQRRIVHAGDSVYRSGDAFGCLHIVHSGFFKIVTNSPDGREQVVALHFKGDWLGFDGIDGGRYSCDAIALDTGDVWSIPYSQLVTACMREPALLGILHKAMSREIARERESLLSMGTLPADARVADFLRYWAESLAERGLRTDQITLRMTRAEIGNYLGMTLETVSRALSRMASADVIRFEAKGRREIRIPDLSVLNEFIQRATAPATTTLQ